MGKIAFEQYGQMLEIVGNFKAENKHWNTHIMKI
jgi:hypothetical protein